MANVLSVVWFVIGSVVTLTSLLVWVALMMPRPVGRARLWLEAKPAASFSLGVLFCAVTLPAIVGFALMRKRWMQGVLDAPLVATISLNLGISGYYVNTMFRVVHLLLAVPVAVGAIVGGAGISRILAGRIREQMKDDSPVLALVCGALCTSLSMFVPLVGWLIFFPVVGLMSVGAGIMGIVLKRGGEDRPPTLRPRAAHETLSRSK